MPVNATMKIGATLVVALLIAWVIGERVGVGQRTAADAITKIPASDPVLTNDQIRTMLETKIDAPELSVITGEGKHSLKQERGKVVLVDFWGTWCGPCRDSIPGILRVYNSRKDKGFTVIGVALEQDDGKRVPAFVKSMGMNYTVGLPNNKEELKNYPFNSLPAMLLVDRQGRIRWAQEGYSSQLEKHMSQLVDALLEEKS
jgi:thiol-disulfide isomerase/thioredoxin